MDIIKELPKPPEFEGMSQYRPPKCFELAGEKYELVLDDGYEYGVEFLDRDFLTFGRKGEEPKKYAYDCAKPEDVTYFVNFEMTGTNPRMGATLVLDMEQMLVTANFCTVGENPRHPHMPKPRIIMGAIRKPDGTLNPQRHGYTRDLVGRAISWRYGNLAVVHVYSSEHYYRMAMTPEARAERMRINPEGMAARMELDKKRLYEDKGDYIKVKDGIYIFHANEEMNCLERGNGNNLFFLMNLNRMHDVGRSFGHNDKGEPENYIYGAIGEYFDASEVLARKSTEYIR